MATLVCVVCKTSIGDRHGDAADRERFLLLRGGREEAHCSQICLVANVERLRLAGAATRRRWLLRATALALIVIAAPKLSHRARPPRRPGGSAPGPPCRSRSRSPSIRRSFVRPRSLAPSPPCSARPGRPRTRTG